MDPADSRISTFRAPTGCARAIARSGTLAVARPGCLAAFVGVCSTAALVLRFSHLVADPENSQRNPRYRRLQLGRWDLALVSLPPHDAPDWGLVRSRLLRSNANCDSDSSAEGTRRAKLTRKDQKDDSLDGGES